MVRKINSAYLDLDFSSATLGQVLTADGAGSATFENSGGGGGVPVGSIVSFAGSLAPTGFLLCDGSAISRITYERLFGVVGTTYGIGDGITTFNLPDTRQKFILGLASSGTGSTLGDTGGSIDHTHTVPSHFHGKGTISITSSGNHVTSIEHNHPARVSTNEAAHSHTINHNHDAFTSGANSVGHTHSISHNHATAVTTGGDHLHGISMRISPGFSVAAGALALNVLEKYPFPGAAPPWTESTSFDSQVGGQHQHNIDLPLFSGSSGSQSANHTHSIDVPSYSGSSSSDGSHSHTVDLPNFVANSSSTGAHIHSNSDFSGSVGNTGGVAGDSEMLSGTQNPPFIVTNYIIRFENISSGLTVELLKSHDDFPNSGQFSLTDAIQTTDAVATTMTQIAVADNSVMRFEVMVVARYENTGINKSYWASITGAVRRNNAGAATIVGTSISFHDDEGVPGYSAIVDTTGNDLRIRVSGASSENVNWASTIKHQVVSLSI